jgi:hypothetical protein
MVKKRAFRNTAEEKIISCWTGRILPIVRIIRGSFVAADIVPRSLRSLGHLIGKRTSFWAYFTCPSDEVTKKGVLKDTVSRTAVSYMFFVEEENSPSSQISEDRILVD